jgi:hypothetical protein
VLGEQPLRDRRRPPRDVLEHHHGGVVLGREDLQVAGRQFAGEPPLQERVSREAPELAQLRQLPRQPVALGEPAAQRGLAHRLGHRPAVRQPSAYSRRAVTE